MSGTELCTRLLKRMKNQLGSARLSKSFSRLLSRLSPLCKPCQCSQPCSRLLSRPLLLLLWEWGVLDEARLLRDNASDPPPLSPLPPRRSPPRQRLTARSRRLLLGEEGA